MLRYVGPPHKLQKLNEKKKTWSETSNGTVVWGLKENLDLNRDNIVLSEVIVTRSKYQI